MSTAIRMHATKLLGRHGDAAVDLADDAIESGGTGAVLGLISTQRKGGLDITLKSHSIPVDLVGGGIGLVASCFGPLSSSMRRRVCDISKVAFGIGVFRQIEKKSSGSAHGELELNHGHPSDDAILEAAKLL